MATIDLGRIKFKWQGAWSSSTAYVVDDVVESGGNAYVCIAASTNNVPPNATYWELMAQKGTDTSVATTQGDIIYHNGTSLARLGAGTSGHFLKTQGTGANPVWAESGGKFESQLFHATGGVENPSSGAWAKATLNTIKTNEITSASMSSGVISLPSGTYYSHSFSAHYRVNGYNARLYDTTNSTTLALGNGGHTWSSPNDASSPNAIVVGRFTLSGTANVEYQIYHDTQNSQTSYQSGQPNHVQIWKIA